MTFNVEVTENAAQNVDDILGYIGKRSRQGMAAWWSRWCEVVDELGTAADRQTLAPENEDHEEEIRHLIFKTRRGLPYRALFVVRERTVFVIHVRGPGQDILSASELQLPD